MQERYLGDSHDFVKYALLRHLRHKCGFRIGVNWYLTRPQDVDRAGSNDGEKRHHLNGKSWQGWDPDLFDCIRHFDDRAERRLERIEEWEILPADTLYFEELVPVANRLSWHRRAKSNLAEADLVFLDPDNGFEVKSMSPRTSPKYAYYTEVIDYLSMSKVIVSIQFARQCDPIKRGLEIREKLHTLARVPDMLPIVRGRVAPNILFFTLAPPSRVSQVKEALLSFAKRSPKAEIIP